MSARRRLDIELVRRGLASSRAQAQQLVADGKVLVNGANADNAARQVNAGEPVKLLGPPPRFVSRGGEKLEGALEHYGIDVNGKRALDVGASTGGFTDCLLQRGATSVVALDVGHGQLHEKIQRDERVDARERMNIRHVDLAEIGGVPFDVITIDVSFISLRTVAGVIAGPLARTDTDIVALIKPQFEAGRAEVSKGKGVIKDPETWKQVIQDVVGTMGDLGAATMGVMASPLLGAEGNVEFLAWFRAHQAPATVASYWHDSDLDELISGLAA